ncbi:hypothetical protein FOQG_13180 [Fusarium oxysporum f. sp. raphani 54005]|uniref:Rhodopsin domain-containing protein n=3 Tax=Fusarium oxysporum TaxID=5507 RepID=X0CIQ9_FUSOX|nr:hypothetical protein FOQG_13180 [Fusarium oxysporum f. sp. raphani 54005]
MAEEWVFARLERLDPGLRRFSVPARVAVRCWFPGVRARNDLSRAGRLAQRNRDMAVLSRARASAMRSTLGPSPRQRRRMMISLSPVVKIPAVVLAFLVARYGVGSRDANILNQIYLVRATEYQTYWELLYFTSSTIIKCAIGFTSIRLYHRNRVVFPICVNMSIMVIVTVLALAFVFANCKPFNATWNPALGTCQKVISLQTVSYIVSAIQMATDWTCAIIPFFIVAGLQISRRRKISVIAILGLGVSASIATCILMPYLKYYDVVKYPNEIAYHLGVVSITSNVECCLGIIACSLPPLRKLFNIYYGSSHEGNYQYTGKSENVLQNSGQGIRLDSINGRKGSFHASAQRVPSRARDHETDDDNSSSKGIIRKTEVRVSSSRYNS